MIFLGDIASPNPECSKDFLESMKKHLEVFKGQCVVANLEGLFFEKSLQTNKPVLYNHPTVLETLNLINTRVLSLANNHVLDLPGQFTETKRILQKNNIQYCGAGIEKEEAEATARFVCKGQTFLVLGCSWDVLMQHQQNRPGNLYVNPIEPKRILKTIEDLRSENPDAKIVMKMHWNFDLETLPFPMHRKFSRAMIDAGANAVIGSHSHCVQGGERYNDGIIIYGLGNFFFPWYVFTGGTSRFPDWTRTELALEWDPETNKVVCHWFEYEYEENRHKLNYLDSEDFDNGEKIKTYSPFQEMDPNAYIGYYKKNRRKGFLIPVYKDHRDTTKNKLIDFYLKSRIRAARFLAKHKIRKWNR